VSIIDIVINIFEVIPKDIARMNQETLIQAPLITGFFYFVSRWFRAYILRLGLFIIGALIVFRVLQAESFLFRFDFYAGLGLLLPHIEMVELTILILKERLDFLYEKTLELILLLVSPFVWLFDVSRNILGFFKAKQKQKDKQEAYEKYYKKESKHKQKNTHQEYRKKQGHNQQKQTKQEIPKQQETKTFEWWESEDIYERLQLKKGATLKEVKKAKKRLHRIYHPDYVFDNDEKRKKHTIIFQNVTNAYDEIIKKLNSKV
jgi:hypothetical protein